MMCYKDMTFCPDAINKRCVERKTCRRVMTDQDKNDAADMDCGVSFFMSQPTCFKDKKKKLVQIGTASKKLEA